MKINANNTQNLSWNTSLSLFKNFFIKKSLKYFSFVSALLFALSLFFSSTAHAKMRIAYVEGGHLQQYTQLLDSTAIALDKIKLIDNARIFLQKGYTSKDLWNWLATRAGGEYLSFVQDAYYSSAWDANLLSQDIASLKKRIEEKKDIDLIFAFGSAAALEVSQQIQNVNIIAFSLPDALLTELSQKNTYQANPSLFAHKVNNDTLKKLELFKNIIDFNSLGICYEDSARGRTDINYQEIKQAAQLYNFTLIEGKIKNFTNDIQENVEKRLDCHQEISQKADAFYLTSGLGNDYTHYKELLTPFLSSKTPTFSQNGLSDVEHGALFALSSSIAEDANLKAQVIKDLIDEKNFTQINKEVNPKYTFALNIKMALDINWNLSFELLSAADRIFREIKNAKQ